MTITQMFRCSKQFPHPDGDQAVELLLIKSFGDQNWTARPRCADHPAAGDIPMLQKVNPATVCAIVPLDGVRAS
jgi:hypothetical protein